MDNEKAKLPTGALIACILIVVFILASIAGIAFLIKRELSREPGQEASADKTSAAKPTPGADDLPFTTIAPGTDHGTYDPDGSLSAVEIIAKCMDSVVSIDITMSNGSENVYAGSGSGVLVSHDGYIATCNHVVEGAATIKVYLNDGTQYEAELIGNDPVTDIAVVKIEAPEGAEFPYATVGTSEGLRVGQRVYAIGNALGTLSNTVTDGIISGLDRDIEIDGQSMTLLQTSAAINSGNSGGALFTDTGLLIGIVNAKTSGTTSSGASIEGLGFAVPIDLAKPIMSDIVAYGFVTGRPYLGVSTKNVSVGTGFFSYTTYPQVVSVVENGPADKAGIRENDYIIKVNGEAISTATGLRVKINSYKVGDVITVTVMRGNSTFDVTVTLEEKTQKF